MSVPNMHKIFLPVEDYLPMGKKRKYL